ncbi:MAG: hypothetical protein NWF07_00970, partial [Candidatus Bathyarchaeota archaeon]|nr:hypothetical protein [Candidatus Bathyarchaeota archaeon]
DRGGLAHRGLFDDLMFFVQQKIKELNIKRISFPLYQLVKYYEIEPEFQKRGVKLSDEVDIEPEGVYVRDYDNYALEVGFYKGNFYLSSESGTVVEESLTFDDFESFLEKIIPNLLSELEVYKLKQDDVLLLKKIGESLG